jgi:hypothetical protein
MIPVYVCRTGWTVLLPCTMMQQICEAATDELNRLADYRSTIKRVALDLNNGLESFHYHLFLLFRGENKGKREIAAV